MENLLAEPRQEAIPFSQSAEREALINGLQQQEGSQESVNRSHRDTQQQQQEVAEARSQERGRAKKLML